MIAAVDNKANSGGDLQEFDWMQFKFEKILQNNASRKNVFILGSCFEKPAIVILEKQAFTEDQFTSSEENKNFLQNSCLEKIFKNDIYENCICHADARVNCKLVDCLMIVSIKKIYFSAQSQHNISSH